MNICKKNKGFFFSENCSPARYPMLKNCTWNEPILKQTGEDTIISSLSTVIDSNHHNYLTDHIFKGNSLVPAAMILELFAESALWFFSEDRNLKNRQGTVTGIEDFFIERAIFMEPGKAAEVQIDLKQIFISEADVKMQIRIKSKRINKAGKEIGDRVNARGYVIFNEKLSDSKVFCIPSRDFSFFDFPKKEFYASFFPFLGPKFQNATGRFAVAKDPMCLLGEYFCSDKEQRIITGQESGFFTSPLGYDCCIQYQVFLSRIIALIGRLPVGVKKMSIFKRHPSSMPCRVFVECLHIDNGLMTGNLRLLDESDALIMCAEEFMVQKSPYHEYGGRAAFEIMLNRHAVKELKW